MDQLLTQNSLSLLVAEGRLAHLPAELSDKKSENMGVTHVPWIKGHRAGQNTLMDKSCVHIEADLKASKVSHYTVACGRDLKPVCQTVERVTITGQP